MQNSLYATKAVTTSLCTGVWQVFEGALQLCLKSTLNPVNSEGARFLKVRTDLLRPFKRPLAFFAGR